MNEELKLRPGVGLIITRVLSLIFVAAAVVCAYLGFVDPRTEEEKAEQYRLSVVASVAGERAVEALCYAQKEYRFASFEYISVLKNTTLKYVKIVGTGWNGESIKFCYDVEEKRELAVDFFEHAISAGEASDFYSGRTPIDRTTTFKGEELQMLLEEAEKWR